MRTTITTTTTTTTTLYWVLHSLKDRYCTSHFKVGKRGLEYSAI